MNPKPFPLSYCPGGWEAFERLADLFDRRNPAAVCATFDIATEAIADFARSHPAGPCGHPDPHERIAFWDAHLRQRAVVVDDSIPAAYLTELDQGLYGGMLGAEVRFLCDPRTGWISSMVPPLFADAPPDRLPNLDQLAIDASHPWFARYLDQLDIFSAAAAGRFGVSHLILIDSLNFVFELIGATAAYAAAIEAPEWTAQAVDFAHRLNVLIHDTFFRRGGLLAGGTCSNMVGWLRGRVVNESVDPFHMASAAFFERWGREPVERMFARFDGGVVHIHGNGRHLLEAAATLRGLRAIYLGNDRGYPPAFAVLADLKRRVGDVPLVAPAEFAEFAEAANRRRLVGGVKYIVSGAPSADEANRLMDRVRAYRA